MSETVDSTYLAKLLDMTFRRVEQLAREGIIPKKARGKYELVPCIHAYIRYLRKLGEGTDLSLTTQRARLTKSEANISEMKYAHMKGEFFEAEAVLRLWERHIMDCRSRLLALPTRIAPVAFACKSIQEVHGATEKLVHEALNELKSIDVADYSKSGDAEIESVKEEKPKPKKKVVKKKAVKVKSNKSSGKIKSKGESK